MRLEHISGQHGLFVKVVSAGNEKYRFGINHRLEFAEQRGFHTAKAARPDVYRGKDWKVGHTKTILIK
jgi:hypothetical protein